MLLHLGRGTFLGGDTSMSTRLPILIATLLALGSLVPARADAAHINQRHHVRYVLLISIDGLHALDVANYVQSHPSSALAELSSHGVTFSNARTPSNSDSFPGLLCRRPAKKHRSCGSGWFRSCGSDRVHMPLTRCSEMLCSDIVSFPDSVLARACKKLIR